MRGPNSGFYSAEDADSEGREGKFYLWTEAQIKAVAGHDADFDSTIAALCVGHPLHSLDVAGNLRGARTPQSQLTLALDCLDAGHFALGLA